MSIDGMKQYLMALKKLILINTMKIIRQHVADEYIIFEFIMTGTHKGDFVGITPMYKVVDGRTVGYGGHTNTFETFSTLFN